MRPAEVKIGGPNRATATKAVRSRRGCGTKVGPVVSFEMKDRFRYLTQTSGASRKQPFVGSYFHGLNAAPSDRRSSGGPMISHSA